MALKLLDAWKGPVFTVAPLGAAGRYVSHGGRGVKTALMTTALCRERTLVLKNKSVRSKASFTSAAWGAICVWYCYEQGLVIKLKYRRAKSVGSLTLITAQKSSLRPPSSLPGDLGELPFLLLHWVLVSTTNTARSTLQLLYPIKGVYRKYV